MTAPIDDLKTLRTELGWSLRRMGEAMDTSQTTVWELETGRRSPTIEQLDRWASALNVRIRISVERPEDDDRMLRIDPDLLLLRLTELLPRLSRSQYDALSTVIDSMSQGTVKS